MKLKIYHLSFITAGIFLVCLAVTAVLGLRSFQPMVTITGDGCELTEERRWKEDGGDYRQYTLTVSNESHELITGWRAVIYFADGLETAVTDCWNCIVEEKEDNDGNRFLILGPAGVRSASILEGRSIDDIEFIIRYSGASEDGRTIEHVEVEFE